MAVAVFRQPNVVGEAVAVPEGRGTRLRVTFTLLPRGEHGFHIHRAGDLRGEGCAGACDHYHKGAPASHGPAPGRRGAKTRRRHTGDLGNISIEGNNPFKKSYYLNVRVEELWGRSLIVHADKDDEGLGGHPDSTTTGHSGARIACAIFGRAMCKN
jgi:Cu-Zn family superoxide dismutase